MKRFASISLGRSLLLIALYCSVVMAWGLHVVLPRLVPDPNRLLPFRGDLVDALARKSSEIAAWLGSSLLFALCHLRPSPVALLVTFVLGLIYGALRLRYRSLLACSLAHAGTWCIVGAI